MQTKSIKLKIISAAVLCSILLISGAVTAGEHEKISYLDNCKYLPLVNNPKNPSNKSVCVDAPVALEKVKVVFDMTQGVEPGKQHTGLRHMSLFAKALKGRMMKGKIKAENISIIGVIHGSTALKALATKNNMSVETKKLVDTIFEFKNKGVNINLEVCGVTLHGMKTKSPKADFTLYKNLDNVIHINQGAIGRMIDLQQKNYTLIKE